ncbi:hypothetical protein LTS18_007124, partial [Coniosporium uncinatum]
MPDHVRLYVGNLPYQAQPEDVPALFETHNLSLAKLDMSMDPFSGRYPSYCFVELPSCEDASRAMQDVAGQLIMNRPVKIKPATKGHVQNSEWNINCVTE